MKHIAVVFFIVCGTPALAQFSKGDKTLGGNLYATISQTPENSKRYSSRTTTLGFNPKFGIFVNKNLEIGVLLGYSSSSEYTSTMTSGGEYSSQGFTAGLYENKYFQITENFLFSLWGSVRYSYTKYFGRNNESSFKYIEARFGPNLIFFPTPNWALTADLGGTEYSYSISSNASKRHVFNVSLGRSFRLGLSYYFRK